MEFLRFGSSIPGSYWGCCAVCIIQNFKVDPDKPYSIEIVNGDAGQPTGGFFGKTYREVFWARLREGTFGTGDMPNHGFLAILTAEQVSGGVGKKWLAILKEAGFEFIRTVSNSVYDGQSLGKPGSGSSHPNYIFGMFRNIGRGAVKDQFTPPHQWTELSKVVDEPWELYQAAGTLMTEELSKVHTEIWNKIGPARRYNEVDLEKAGVPIHLGGRRALRDGNGVCCVGYPQEPKEKRKNGTVVGQVGASKTTSAFPKVGCNGTTAMKVA